MTTFLPGNAKPAAQQWLLELGRMLQEEGVDELRLQRIRREAEKLKPVAPADAFEILGAVAALSWNLDALHENHSKAIQIGGTTTQHLYNYGVSLAAVCDYRQALEHYIQAFEQMREDLFLLRTVIRAAIRTGLFDTAAQYLAIAKRQDPQGEDWPHVLVERVLAWMRDKDLSEADVAEVFDATYGVLRQARQRPVHFDWDLNDYDELVARLRLPVSPERSAEIDEKIADVITAEPLQAERWVLVYTLGCS